MNEQLRHDFECAGVLSDIYAGIDTYGDDMAKIVRASLNGLQKINELHEILTAPKSKEVSIVSRNLGNEHYRAGRNRQAVQCYNKSLAYAPKFTEEMILAYSNRSAVFFKIRYFSACLSDINICLSMGCSESLDVKLNKRRALVAPFLFEEGLIQMLYSSEFVNTYFRFNCKRNPEVSCASADVAFVSRDGVKRATAGGNIRPGTVVAFERAFATSSVNHELYEYLSCYYCNRPELCLFPCEGCCRALFCGKECQDLCMKEYHCIECHIVDELGKLYDNNINMLMTKTAIKLSLKMTWDRFITASKDIGASRMRTATVKQAFNSEEPLSILSYMDNNIDILEGRIFNGSIFCAYILNCLSKVPAYYFPKEATKREEAMDAMARVMLHLYVTFNNKISILSSGYDFNSKTYKSYIQHSIGWFSMSSKLQHSCEPNLLVVGLNDSIALVALRTIKRGEALTISYSVFFHESVTQPADPMSRTLKLFMLTRYMCDCRICKQNWDSKSLVTVKMTQKQSKLMEKVNKVQKCMTYECYDSLCRALDAFPINSVQYKKAYEGVMGMLNPLQSKYFNNKTYLD